MTRVAAHGDPSTRDAQAVATALAVDLSRGLDSQEAALRLARDGPNELRATLPVPRWRKVLAQFQDPLVYLLLGAIAIALIAWFIEGRVGWPIDALVIAAIVALNGVLGHLQESRAEDAVAAANGCPSRAVPGLFHVAAGTRLAAWSAIPTESRDGHIPKQGTRGAHHRPVALTPPARSRWRRLSTLAAVSMLVASAATWAAPSLPWSPSAADRHRLALLVDEGGLQLPLGQWPLPRDAVVRALDALPAALDPTLDAARASLRAALRRAAGPRATLALRGPQELPAGFGDDAVPGSALTLRSPAIETDGLALRLGARVERDDDGGGSMPRVLPEDSALAVEGLGVQLQAWSGRRWWGPGWQSSLVLGNNAPALTGIGLQRAAALPSTSVALGWLGAWNAEVFVARLEGVTTPAHPMLIGSRLTLRPFDGLEIGLTRTAQWGGRGRPNSLGSLFDAVLGQGLNADTDGQRAADPANEMAGLDLRWRCPAGAPCAGYLQVIGEDEAGHLPSRTLGLYGLEFWSADGRHRGFVEFAETGCDMPVGRGGAPGCAYRNYAYPEGYVSRQRWLGASLGPDSRVTTLGWNDTATGVALRLHGGRIGSRIGRFAAFDDRARAGRLLGAVARRAWTRGGVTIEPEIGWTRLNTPQGGLSDARVGITLTIEAGSPP